MRQFNCVSMFTLGVVLMAGHVVHASNGDNIAINAMCPIGKEPIVLSAGTIEYKGNTIGVCCPGCGAAFLAWDEARKDEFVTMATQNRESGQNESQVGIPTEDAGDDAQAASAGAVPYPFDVCPVADGKLGSMGDPVVKVYEGRQVKFCCDACIGTFETDKTRYFRKLDDQIIVDQMRYYPSDICVVTGDPLVADGVDTAINLVHENRLVRLCGKMCVEEFNENPDTYISELDALVAAAQRDDYPLETCIVAGSELGSMGEPTEMIVAGRLILLCCAACEPKVEQEPLNYVAEIDTAWQAAGRFEPHVEKN